MTKETVRDSENTSIKHAFSVGSNCAKLKLKDEETTKRSVEQLPKIQLSQHFGEL